jgi:DNA polymerase elongation subunit (family B)
MYISAMLSPKYDKVFVWERTGKTRKRKEYPLELYFFIQQRDGEYQDIYGNPLAKLEFDNFSDYSKARKNYRSQGIKMYESDISVEQKVLAKHYYEKPVKDLNLTFFDIEVDYDKNRGFFGAKDAYAPISSISLYHAYTGERIILALPPQHSPWEPSEREYSIEDISENVLNYAKVTLCSSERELLNLFLEAIENTDVISGWNSDGFDVPYIYKRIIEVLGKRALSRLSFRDAKAPTIKTIEREISPNFRVEEEQVTLYGRASVDYQTLYKKFTMGNKASYALAYIADEENLELDKLEYDGSLYDLYREDFSYYLEYNMIDTEIMVELEKKLSYFRLTLDLTHMATGQLTSVYGTIKLAELAIINHCHYELDMRVPDSQRHDFFGKYGGAFVLDCMRGEHKWVGSIDVESLYPTSIICANVSPETIIGQFSRDNKDFEAMYHATDDDITLVYENGMEETRSTEQWRKYFKEQNYTISGFGTVFNQNQKGFIPAILENWFDERKKYKGHLGRYKEKLKTLNVDDPDYAKTKAKVEHYNRFQYIKKIQLNSLYGCMGNKFFKFFDVRLAESTTKTGREILLHMARKIGEEFNDGYKYPNKMVVYGDTDSCYFKTNAENLKEARLICDYIERVINKSFGPFMEKYFFSDHSVAKRVRVENEVISDISIFVKPKIYLMHLLVKDGDDCDEVKIMGHAIKKTGLPKTIKNELKASIEEYFITHDWSQFLKRVVDFKHKIRTTDVFEDYGLPKKVNKVEKYEKDYEEDPTCRISGGQAAAMLWNILLDKYEDKESMRITSGTSVRVYNLTKKIGRFQTIAVPADLMQLPEWFKDAIMPIIDRDVQVDKLVNLTLTNICDAIGKQIPTQKAVMADELLVF